MLDPDRDQPPQSSDCKDANMDILSTAATPADLQVPSQQAQTSSNVGWLHRTQDYVSLAVRHATKHTGVGIICAVAYFDP